MCKSLIRCKQGLVTATSKLNRKAIKSQFQKQIDEALKKA
jgi:hypothetical protein